MPNPHMSAGHSTTTITTASPLSHLQHHPSSLHAPADAKLSLQLNGHSQQPMDNRQTDYPQSGLSSPYPPISHHQSEPSSADQASAAQYPQSQDPRSSNFSSSATPSSEYSINPSSARSGSFPDYIQRPPYQQPGAQSTNPGGMAQATSPSMPLPDGHANSHTPQRIKSDPDVPIDPSIASATSPTYPQPQYSPYQQQHDMAHYQAHPPSAPPMYGRAPDWPSHFSGHPMGHPYPPGASSGPPPPAMVSPVQRPPAVSI